MHDTFRRRYAGSAPWEEVWFLEAQVADGRGIWLRHVITDGAQGDCAVWAMAFDGPRTLAFRDAHPLSSLAAGDGFALRDGTTALTHDRAVGRAGDVRWDLALCDPGRHHTLIPPSIERLRAGRHYVPAIADLRITGAITVGDETWAVDGGRGVLGHIHGGRNRTAAWAWGHCNTFHGSDALFEGLSARLGAGPLTGPPLTSLVLHLEGRRYAFDRVRDLVGSRSTFGGGRWTFRARRREAGGTVTIEGTAELPPAHVVVRYVDPDGRPAWCSNSRFSRLRVRLTDPGRGLDQTLVSDAAAFETGTRKEPGRPADAG